MHRIMAKLRLSSKIFRRVKAASFLEFSNILKSGKLEKYCPQSMPKVFCKVFENRIMLSR